jgi:hypothetical protein
MSDVVGSRRLCSQAATPRREPRTIEITKNAMGMGVTCAVKAETLPCDPAVWFGSSPPGESFGSVFSRRTPHNALTTPAARDTIPPISALTTGLAESPTRNPIPRPVKDIAARYCQGMSKGLFICVVMIVDVPRYTVKFTTYAVLQVLRVLRTLDTIRLEDSLSPAVYLGARLLLTTHLLTTVLSLPDA